MDKVKDPSFIGPGVWYMLHSIASDPKEKDLLLSLINYIRKNFICLECREHFEQFCKKYPPEIYINSDRGFEWTHLVHSNANIHSNKSQIDLQTAKDFYSSNKSCSSCSNNLPQDQSLVKQMNYKVVSRRY